MAVLPPESTRNDPPPAANHRNPWSSAAPTPTPPHFLHGTFKGEPAITIPHEIEASLAAKFQTTLVGKFSQGKPRMDLIRKFIAIQNFKGFVSVGLIDKKHILFRFEITEDYVRLFSRSIWNVEGKPMRILKWTSTFHTDRESSIIPIWISLPMLPIHLVNQGFIFSLVSSFSKPLRIDSATEQLKRPSVARVQVEFDLLDLLPPRVWVQSENGTGFWQAVEMEDTLPTYCNYCWHIGHEEQFCAVKHPELHSYNHKKGPSTHKEYKPKQQQSNAEMVVAANDHQQVEYGSLELAVPNTSLNQSMKEQEQSVLVSGKEMEVNEISTEKHTYTEHAVAAHGIVGPNAEANAQQEHIQVPSTTKIRKIAAVQQVLDLPIQQVELVVGEKSKVEESRQHIQQQGRNENERHVASKCSTKSYENALKMLDSLEEQGNKPLNSIIDDGPQKIDVAASQKTKGLATVDEVLPEVPSDLIAKEIEYPEDCPISNSFKILSIPSTEKHAPLTSSGIDSQNSISTELQNMSLYPPKARSAGYISDRDTKVEKLTPDQKITRFRKKKKIFDL